MMNLASVRDVNSRIKDKISDLSAARFRANIISLCHTSPLLFFALKWNC